MPETAFGAAIVDNQRASGVSAGAMGREVQSASSPSDCSALWTWVSEAVCVG